MPVKFTDHILAAGTHAGRPVAADTPKGALYACTTHNIIYRNSGVGWDNWMAAGGGGAGRDALVFPNATDLNGASGANGPASQGSALLVRLSAPMLLRGLRLYVGTVGTGTHEWGLFDASVNAAAATKIAGGSGALNALGWTSIAATGAPVTVPAGVYVIIFKWPAANMASIKFVTWAATDLVVSKYQATYVWSDTPNLTAGWTNNNSVYSMALHGDLDGSANAWW